MANVLQIPHNLYQPFRNIVLKKGSIVFYDALNTLVYGYMATKLTRGNPLAHFMVYSFLLAARYLLYVPSQRQDSTYYGLCYTSCGGLAGTRNSSTGPPRRIDPTTHRTESGRSTTELCPSPYVTNGRIALVSVMVS